MQNYLEYFSKINSSFSSNIHIPLCKIVRGTLQIIVTAHLGHFLLTILYLIPTETTEKQIQEEREEKKRYLLRKLSFRPSVDELKTRKVRRRVLP